MQSYTHVMCFCFDKLHVVVLWVEWHLFAFMRSGCDRHREAHEEWIQLWVVGVCLTVVVSAVVGPCTVGGCNRAAFIGKFLGILRLAQVLLWLSTSIQRLPTTRPQISRQLGLDSNPTHPLISSQHPLNAEQQQLLAQDVCPVLLALDARLLRGTKWRHELCEGTNRSVRRRWEQ